MPARIIGIFRIGRNAPTAAVVNDGRQILGVAMLAVPDVLPALEDGSLVRLLPHLYSDAGAISLYYASRTLLPAKTRAFVDLVTDAFRRDRLAERFAGSLGKKPFSRFLNEVRIASSEGVDYISQSIYII